MKLDELVLQGASRQDDSNHWLVEPGRVKFAALNRGVFLVLLQVRPTSDTQSSWSKKLWSYPFSLEISSRPFATRVFRDVHVCVRTDHRRVHAWLCLDGHNAAQERGWGSPVDIDRDAQVAPSKTNADDSEDGDMDDNLFSFAELVARARRLRTTRGDRSHWPAG